MSLSRVTESLERSTRTPLAQLLGLVDAAHATAAQPRRIARKVPGGLNIGTPLNPALFPLGNIQAGQGPRFGLAQVTLARAETAVAVPENLGTVADHCELLHRQSNQIYGLSVQWPPRRQCHAKGIASGLPFIGFPRTQTTLTAAAAMTSFHHNELHKALSAIWDHTISSDFLNEFRVNAANLGNLTKSLPTRRLRWASPKTIFFRPAALRSIILVRTRATFSDQWTYTFKDVAYQDSWAPHH